MHYHIVERSHKTIACMPRLDSAIHERDQYHQGAAVYAANGHAHDCVCWNITGGSDWPTHGINGEEPVA